jgi:Cytochrome P460
MIGISGGMLWALGGWMLGCAKEEKDASLFSETDLKSEIEGYEDWAQPEGWVGAVVSCDGSHGPRVDIWYNQIAADALFNGEQTLPDGAALVKEAYEEDGVTPAKMSAMRKVDGFSPDNGDWFWGLFADDGSTLSSGDLDTCYSCHSAGQDRVRFPDSPQVADAADCP